MRIENKKRNLAIIWENYFKQISTKAIMKTRIMNRGTKLLYRESCPQIQLVHYTKNAKKIAWQVYLQVL